MNTIAKFSISEDLARQSITLYPPAQRPDLEWAWHHIVHTLGNEKERAAAEFNYDASVIYKIFAGTYTASLEQFCSSIRQVRLRTSGRPADIIITPVVEKIWDALKYSLDYGAMVVIRGETGRGKTHAAREWCRRFPSQATYMRCLTAMTRGKTISLIAQEMGISTHKKSAPIVENAIFKNLNHTKCLVIDEAGHLFPTRKDASTGPLDFLRDLHDTTGCGIVLIITDYYWNAIRFGRFAPFMEQLVGRIKFNLVIKEDTIYKEEIEAICKAYTPVPTPQLLRAAAEIAQSQEGRLRTLFEDLAKAKRYADAHDQVLTHEHLALAKTWRQTGSSWSLTPA